MRVRYEAIIGQYEAAMAKAGLSTKGLLSTVNDVSTKSTRSFADLARSLEGVGGGALVVGAGVAVAGVAIVKFAKDGVAAYLRLGDEVRAYKDVTGASAEESSRMVAIGHALGVSNDVLSLGMYRLAVNVAQHADKLKALGIETAHTKAGNVDLTGTLGNVAHAWQRAGDATHQADIVNVAFGRGGRALIPILRQTRQELQFLQDQAAQNHQIYTDKDLQAVFQYHVATRELGEAWSGLEIEASRGLIPALTQVTHFMQSEIEGVEVLGRGIGRVVGRFSGAIGSLHDLAFGHHAAATSAQSHAAAEQAAADKLKAETEAIKEYSDALKAAYSSAFAVDDAQSKFNGDLITFADHVRAAQIQGDKYATSLDDATASGIANQGMVRGLTKDILDTADAARQQGEDVTAATKTQREQLVIVMQQLGFSQAAAQKYADVLMSIDGLDVTSTVTVDTTQAMKMLTAFVDLYASIPGTIASPKLLAARHVVANADVPWSVAAPSLIADRAQFGLGGVPPSDGVQQAVAGQGPQATAANAQIMRDAAAANKAAASDAAQARSDWLAAEDTFEKNMFEHGMRSLAEYEGYLDKRLGQEKQYSAGWFAILDERQRVEQQHAADVKAWNDALDANRKRDIDLWMTTAQREYAIGTMSRNQYRAILEARLKDLVQYSDDWFATWQEIHQIDEQIANDQVAAQQKADQANADAFSRLNGLLDQQAALQKQLADSADAHRKRMADIETQFVTDQADALAKRQTDLLAWANITERVSVQWGSSVASIAANVHAQMDLFSQWAAALTDARKRGVSEDVIHLLGLDQGPQALGQLRMFGSATKAQIDDLNAAVAARQRQAGDQVTDEAAKSFTAVSDTLQAIAEKHAAAVESETEQFLADQKSLTGQLAAIGTDQGRSYMQAITDAITSGIPALVAAGQAAAAALAAAQGNVAAGPGTTSQAPTNPDGTLAPRVQASIVGGHIVYTPVAPAVHVTTQTFIGGREVTPLVKTAIDGMNATAGIAKGR